MNTEKRSGCSDNPNEELKRVVTLVPGQHRSDKTTQLVSYWLEKQGVEYVRRNIEYTNQRSREINGYRGYLANAFKHDWADDHPRQPSRMQQIREGMFVEHKGARYRVDATGCVFLSDGACIPLGLLRQKLDAGEFRVIE